MYAQERIDDCEYQYYCSVESGQGEDDLDSGCKHGMQVHSLKVRHMHRRKSDEKCEWKPMIQRDGDI